MPGDKLSGPRRAGSSLSRQIIAMVTGAALYGSVYTLIVALFLQHKDVASDILYGLSVAIPLFFGVIFGPLAGLVTALGGFLLGHAVSGAAPTWNNAAGLGLTGLLAGLDEWLPVVRQRRPAHSWEQVVLAVNQALPPGRRRFTRDRLVRAVRLLVAEGLAEPGLLAPAGSGGARARRRPQTARAVEAVARYLRGHRRERIERGIAPADYRPPTLAQVARHLAEDAKITPPGGGAAWAPSSVKALVERAQRASMARATLAGPTAGMEAPQSKVG